MIEQAQLLLIDIFGLIGFDYDLHTLDNKDYNCTNEFVQALYIYISTTLIFTQLPEVMGRIYLFFNLKYRRAQRIIDQYLNQMIDQELKETSITRAERKKTSFIASLVTSLQETEFFETTNVEENKKGRSTILNIIPELIILLILFTIFRSLPKRNNARNAFVSHSQLWNCLDSISLVYLLDEQTSSRTG